MTAQIERVAVIGGGAWGTALALVALRAGREAVLVARDTAIVAAIAGRRESPYLPGIPLDAGLAATGDLASAAAADLVILAVPAQASRGVARDLAPVLRSEVVVATAAKGLERGSLAPMTRVVADELPRATPAVLSGPSFAADVARGLPTAVTIAAADLAVADAVAAALSGAAFRPYASSDVIGVEIGGALKNVLAIAAGIASGRGLGASAVAAVIARGFAELERLGVALGARPETLAGLSGLGDLVLTATSAQSRNFALGLAIGRGGAASPSGALAEGALTAEAAVALAARHGIEVPISAAVRDVIGGALSVGAAVERLLARPLRRESA